MKGKVAYLSGPMSGLPEQNYPAFNKAATQLRQWGYVVINPAENFGGRLCENAKRADYMRIDLSHVMGVDYVFVLDAWDTSRGARTEVQVAFEIGTSVHKYPEMYKINPYDLTIHSNIIEEKSYYDQPERHDERGEEAATTVHGGHVVLPRCSGGGGPYELCGERTAQPRPAPALGEAQVNGPRQLHTETPAGCGDERRRRYEALRKSRLAGTGSTPDGDRGGASGPTSGPVHQGPTNQGSSGRGSKIAARPIRTQFDWPDAGTL